jgi:hypothetical protein
MYQNVAVMSTILRVNVGLVTGEAVTRHHVAMCCGLLSSPAGQGGAPVPYHQTDGHGRQNSHQATGGKRPIALLVCRHALTSFAMSIL